MDHVSKNSGFGIANAHWRNGFKTGVYQGFSFFLQKMKKSLVVHISSISPIFGGFWVPNNSNSGGLFVTKVSLNFVLDAISKLSQLNLNSGGYILCVNYVYCTSFVLSITHTSQLAKKIMIIMQPWNVDCRQSKESIMWFL